MDTIPARSVQKITFTCFQCVIKDYFVLKWLLLLLVLGSSPSSSRLPLCCLGPTNQFKKLSFVTFMGGQKAKGFHSRLVVVSMKID